MICTSSALAISWRGVFQLDEPFHQVDYDDLTHEKDSDGEISSSKEPECPAAQPSIAISECSWDDCVSQDVTKDGSIIALFNHASDGDRKLEI